MKKIVLLAFFLLAGTLAGNAQDAVCPPDRVCISREAALKALEDSDKVKALEAQVVVLEKAFADTKKLVEDANREFIRVSSENTVLKQQQVRSDAIMDLLLKNTKRKCYPFSICIGG